MKNAQQHIIRDINHMMLAQAFIIVRSAGLKIRVTKLDGVVRKGYIDDVDDRRVNVEVVGGYVKRAWFG